MFLGIVPVLALVGFLMYYTKHNLKLKWNKPPIIAYVLNNIGSFFQHVMSACKGVGNSVYCSKSRVKSVDQHVSSTSNNSLHNSEIRQTGLISTTNKDILYGNSVLLNVSRTKINEDALINLGNFSGSICKPKLSPKCININKLNNTNENQCTTHRNQLSGKLECLGVKDLVQQYNMNGISSISSN